MSSPSLCALPSFCLGAFFRMSTYTQEHVRCKESIVHARPQAHSCSLFTRSYKFDTTTSALAVSNRPAYGGICYSNNAISQSETARIYDANGSSATQMWSPSTTGAQAWAHPIDGWAASGVKVTVGCAAPSSSSKNSKATTSTK